ncbi:hypothetical protein FXO38_15724 [Capsicum annuum]|nr:hypothetical protein FXO37_20657 [Capsicum annuum]KAF3653277.1 hypothetical protein FXO38_15724 [Capsicum annuum]
MPPPSNQFHTSSFHNSLHSISSSVPSTSSIPSLSRLRIGGPRTLTSPSIDSAIVSNDRGAVSQNLKFKKIVEYDRNRRLIIISGGQVLGKMDTPEYKGRREWAKTNRASEMGGSLHTGVDPYFGYEVQRDQSIGKLIMNFKGSGILKWGKRANFFEVFKETHKKKKKDGTGEDWVETCAKDAYVVQKKGRTYRCGFLQSSSSSSLFPNPSSTLQTMEEIEAMRKQIVELTQQCAANDAKFAKFEELAKKHMPQVFHDGEESEPDDN